MGVVGMLLLSRLDYHAVLDKAPILYVIGIIALVAVLAVGHTRFGAKRWLPVLGSFSRCQNSSKLIIIVVLARFFAEVRTDRLTLGDLFKACAADGCAVGLDHAAAGPGHGPGAGSAGGGGGVSGGPAMEAHRWRFCCSPRLDGSRGLSFSEALSERTCYHIPAPGRRSQGFGLPDPAIENRRGFRRVSGARDSATEARINWASCRCGIRILFWRRLPRSLALPESSWRCCCICSCCCA